LITEFLKGGPLQCDNTTATLDRHLRTQEETMGNHLRHGQVRLYLVPADGPVRDDRAAVARALLDRWYPICQVLTDQAMANLGDDLAAFKGLENDPRYLIGRLSQALTALLERDVPPLDATAQLLSEAIEDAVNYRRRVCRDCPPDSFRARCAADWSKAERYEGLWRDLGLIDELPRPRPRLKRVT
jgi:hypothetical protein